MVHRYSLLIFNSAVLLLLGFSVSFANDNILVGENAPELDRYAAAQLQDMLARLSDDSSLEDGIVFLIGNPETNPAIPKSSWPKVSEQGIVLKATSHNGKPALIVGGGSPAATLWSVYELGYRQGIRYMLREDIYPDKPTPLNFNNLDLVIEPNLSERIWHLDLKSPLGPSSWPLTDQKHLLLQLAKKKFNHLFISVYPWQPFVQYQSQGIQKKTATLWRGEQFPIPRDAPGRTAFGTAKKFDNPDFADKTSYTEKIQAGQTQLQGIIDTAHQYGLKVSLIISPLAFPPEFADLSHTQLANTKIKAYTNTYPNLDRLYLKFPKQNEQAELVWQVISQQLGKENPQRAIFIEGLESKRISPPPPSVIQEILSLTPQVTIFTHSQNTSGILSQSFSPRLESSLNKIRQQEWRGFSTNFQMITEHDPDSFFLARNSWDKSITAHDAHNDLLATITGSQSVADRLWLAFGHIEKATQLIESNDPTLAQLAPNMLLKHYQPSPEPKWWTELNESYTQAMIELYRSHDAAAPGSRPLLFYWAKRSEYVLEYLSCVKSLRAAGIAKSSGDSEAAIEQLETAIEQLYNALDTLGDVARDQGDRGLIAVLNAYAYRPLMVEYEKLLSEE